LEQKNAQSSNQRLKFMFRKIFLILILGISLAKGQNSYSIEWLKSGCSGLSKYSEKSENITEQEAKDAVQVGVWLQGYLQAVEMLSYSNDANILPVPKKWNNSLEVAKSLLAYLNEFEQKHKVIIPDDFAAKSFVATWYDVKNPQIKPLAAYALEQLFLQIYFPEAFEKEMRSNGKEPEPKNGVLKND